ncbi:MAG: hypothetical protein J2P32_14785, partial [Actinobacteria bacterium]|nr:hypothetical protein [Actinomycetota bacterium]
MPGVLGSLLNGGGRSAWQECCFPSGEPAGIAPDLRAISGPTENEDFFTTDFADLADTLDRLARESCAGSINVTKLVIPPGGTKSDARP